MQPTGRPPEHALPYHPGQTARSAALTLRAHVQLSVFLLHVMTRGLRGEDANPLKNPRCCLHGPFEKRAQLAFGQAKLKKLPDATAMALKSGDCMSNSAARVADTAT